MAETARGESEDGSLIDRTLLEILRCPACAGLPQPDPGVLDLVADAWLVCQDCQRKYPIRDRIPVMLIEKGDQYRDTPVEELGEP
jgi:uncharacterized protein YbaR (Trm112 family)